MMPYMYILECADSSYYTGSTKNLERRLWQHKNGLGANHTAKRLPVKLVYCEFYDRISDAFYREKQVQGWSRKKKQALMAGDTNELHRLAECQNETHCRRAGLACPELAEGKPLSQPPPPLERSRNQPPPSLSEAGTSSQPIAVTPQTLQSRWLGDRSKPKSKQI